MIKLIFFIIYFPFLLTADPGEDVRVRVRVETNQPKFEIQGQNLKIENLRLKGSYIQIAEKRSSNKNETKWIYRTDFGEQKVILKGAIQISGSPLIINQKQVLGDVLLRSRSNGLADAITSVDLEEYIEGVVFSEMGPHFPIEALKAQAVAARSYTLARLAGTKFQTFDMESTQVDQVFKWHPEGSPVSKAVRDTAGLVLKSKKGKLVSANFHSDCGGQTAKASEIWGGKSLNSVSVKDSSCALYSNWELEVPISEMRQTLASLFHKKVSSIAESAKTESGRVHEILISFSDNSRESVSAEKLRKLFGYNRLKSTKFHLSISGENYIFKGKGFGHGVGLCQMGAKFMATAQKNYLQILDHYFPGLPVSYFETPLRITARDPL